MYTLNYVLRLLQRSIKSYSYLPLESIQDHYWVIPYGNSMLTSIYQTRPSIYAKEMGTKPSIINNAIIKDIQGTGVEHDSDNLRDSILKLDQIFKEHTHKTEFYLVLYLLLFGDLNQTITQQDVDTLKNIETYAKESHRILTHVSYGSRSTSISGDLGLSLCADVMHLSWNFFDRSHWNQTIEAELRSDRSVPIYYVVLIDTSSKMLNPFEDQLAEPPEWNFTAPNILGPKPNQE